MRAREFANTKLVIFDIDDTLVNTDTKVGVVRDGKTVRQLNSHDFTHYKLQPGEEFDFGAFRDAQEFFANARPIAPMIRQLRNDIATGNKVIMVTARADFDDRETFLNTFRKYGVDMDRVHVYRAGNIGLKVPTEEKKKMIIRTVMGQDHYDKVIMYDDALPNLQAFLSLASEYPWSRFYAWHVDRDGSATEYHRSTVKEDTAPRAAGCVLYAEDTGRWGFQQRSDSVTDPGIWSTWGGGRESGETLEQCVRRELAEESGYQGPLELEPLHSTGQYATFIGRVPQEFEPKINSEVKDWCWVDADNLPEPLHHKLYPVMMELIHKKILHESISPVVYHFTTIGPALKILQSGEFELSSVLGSVEQQYAPRGYPYFLSTTRTRRGGYHSTVGSTGVLFVLDGTWFNQRYPGGSIDYWLNRNPQQSHHREHEAEDRVFSRDPTIPITGVTGLHVYLTPDAYPDQLAQARQLLIAAKRLGIDTKLYRDETAWRNFDTRNTADVGQLRGQERTGGRISTHPGYLLPWIQLLTARDKSQLNKDADKIRYSLAYTYNREDAARGLSTDLSNARKPNSGPDREHAVKIIQFMRKNNLGTVKDLVAALAQKWRIEDKKVDENFSDGKKPGRKGLAKRMGVPTRASVTRLRQIANTNLDQVLAQCCKMVVRGQQQKPQHYGMVAACVIDPDNRRIYGINLPDRSGQRRHAERVAIERYQDHIGPIPPGSTVVTTCSPCNSDMPERTGDSCKDLLNQVGIEHVYTGYVDPTQHNDNDAEFTVTQTANDQLWSLCQLFAQTFINRELPMSENFADGRKPGRKGLAKRVGVNCKQSVSKLRSIAKKSSGERQRMAHWCANMKSGKRKK